MENLQELTDNLTDRQLEIDELRTLVNRGHASMSEVSTALSKLSIEDLSEQELIEVTEAVFNFPTVVRAGTAHPNNYLRSFEEVLYYHTIKGLLTDKLAHNQRRRLSEFRYTLGGHIGSNYEAATAQHRVQEHKTYDITDVKARARNLVVESGWRLRPTLEAMARALHCPDIINPDEAIEAFGGQWYSAMQFQLQAEYGLQTIPQLRADGRIKMFMKAADNLSSYLQSK